MSQALEELSTAAAAWGAPLDAAQLARAQAYVSLMIERSARVNLTAETDPEELLLRHLADGLPAAALLRRLLSGAARPRLADVGAGGGFIGFAIKLAWPEAEVTLIEALQRKFDFLNVAALRSGLKGLRVVKARAGAMPAGGPFDAVVERALAPLPVAVSVAAPLLGPGSYFVAYQSDPPDLSAPELQKALARARATFVDLVTYRLPRESRDRSLAVFRRED